MDEKISSVPEEGAVSLAPQPTSVKLDSDSSECKKQNCLCAPTTHVGSFRCRLHRFPPPSPASTVKRGFSSQKLLAPKVKFALQHKLKQGDSPKASSSSSSRLSQDKPGLSRLSKTCLTHEQNPSLQSDHEALTVLWKTSRTALTGNREGALHDVKHVDSSEVNPEKLSSSSIKRYVRPLVRLPSI